MIPRGKLDIHWSDLRFAAARCVSTSQDSSHLATLVERAWDPSGKAFACLSVRTGWDLVLQALAWPAGSEVLMSSITIRDMAEIVRRHHLIPVPLDVDPRLLTVDPLELQARITEKTKGVLIAHLFGSRMSLRPIAERARERGLLVLEDAAQAYAAQGDRADPAADVSFFSFGPIKAQTALGGALLQFREENLLQQVRLLHDSYPWQTSAEFCRRLVKFMLLHGLSNRPLMTVLAGVFRMLGADFDRFLSQSMRGFGKGDLLAKIRRRPSAPLLELLRRRVEHPDVRWLEHKSRLAERIRQELPAEFRLGDSSRFPSHWVLPIRVRDPEATVRRLVAAGYDATRHASNMAVLETPPERPNAGTSLSTAWAAQLLYLPLHPSLTPAHATRMAQIVREANPS